MQPSENKNDGQESEFEMVKMLITTLCTEGGCAYSKRKLHDFQTYLLGLRRPITIVQLNSLLRHVYENYTGCCVDKMLDVLVEGIMVFVKVNIPYYELSSEESDSDINDDEQRLDDG
jgi:hypothetical protein